MHQRSGFLPITETCQEFRTDIGNEYRGKVMFTDIWIDIDTGTAYGEHPALLRLDDKKVFYV